MSSTYALRDSTTMLRRDLRHLQRYPGLSLFPILMPVVFLLLVLMLVSLAVTIAVALLTRRLDARRPTLVRRESALHPDHRHRAQRARQPARRQRRRQGDPVVPRDHRRQLSLGQVSLQPPTRPVDRSRRPG